MRLNFIVAVNTSCGKLFQINPFVLKNVFTYTYVTIYYRIQIECNLNAFHNKKKKNKYNDWR